ncbi:MAG: FkbM family methyltransferase [Verrucomicrobia bacterium]|nr:FkbM family methyltransferase [Verrucomicrobiota bacterium]
MRLSLLYNPIDLIERLAIAAQRRRRFRRLRGTPAAGLSLGHIGSLELLELLRPAPPAVIYDIGANVGTWTCLAKSLFPAAQVEAFEPLEQHHAEFARRTAAWPGTVRLHSPALGAMEHTAQMHVMDFSDASSLLALGSEGAREFNIHEAGEKTVPVVPLDVLVARANLPPPDLLKLDVQGYELEVLRGATATLRHARAVLCEVSFREFYTGQAQFPDILAFLTAEGFALHAFGHGLDLGQPLVQADALFLRPPLR